jgi:hypothetical protein
VDARLVIEELAGQPQADRPPVQPQRIGGDRHQHGAHAEVDPAGLAQHGGAGIDQRPAGAPGGQGREMGRVPVVFTQAVVAAVQVAEFERGLAFQFLDEMAMPVQPADEGLQAGAMPAGAGWQPGGEQPCLLHHLAQAQATQRQVGRQPRQAVGAESGDEMPPRYCWLRSARKSARICRAVLAAALAGGRIFVGRPRASATAAVRTTAA